MAELNKNKSLVNASKLQYEILCVRTIFMYKYKYTNACKNIDDISI